ncbi:hypothetical protein Adt_39664 [Abeliophyllum distichum]|uniref:Uncharacterized protein n=1 Tax=Abeliophyllum distichum TaxID=126358 RepID=A0ABD1Q5Q2_9LAMI
MNYNFDDIVAEKERQLAKIKGELAKVEVNDVMSYKKEFSNMLEYLRLANLFMVAGEKKLVERIREVHPEWDLSFLRQAIANPHALMDSVAVKVLSSVEPQAKGEVHITPYHRGKPTMCRP